MAARPAALITGGAQRVGAAISKALAAKGYAVAVHYRYSEVQAQALCDEMRSQNPDMVAVKADLADEADTDTLVARAAEALGRPLTLLVNNASTFVNDDITNVTKEGWDFHIGANLWAPMKLARDFVAQVPDGNDNQIINLIDQRVWALTPKFFSYTLSKAALFTATQTLAQALGPQGIRVNGIGPGPTLKNIRQSDADWDKQNATTILRRGATPDDITAALLYLLSAKAVTGQMIAVDGGQHLAWETPDVLINE